MLSRKQSALLLGLAVGAIGAIVGASPVAGRFEESAGLQWLFALRGTRQPPGNIHIVSIDRPAAEALGLPLDSLKWPRSAHASLIHRLAQSGVRVIAFDVFFGEARPEDAELAAAMRGAGNVVLTARLQQRFVPLVGPDGKAQGEAVSVELQAPVATLAESALAVAPFSLPAWPFRVSQFWAFHEGAGDRPTLPAVVLQAYANPVREQLQSVLNEAWRPVAATGGRPTGASSGAHGQLNEFMQAARDRFLALPDAAADVRRRLQDMQHDASLPVPSRDLLRKLAGLYAGPASYYLNYYGPPQTIPTHSYHEVLEGAPLRTADGRAVDLRDAIVFVGWAARRQPDQRDSFLTPFSLESGLHLSGVEIAATATANLLEGRPLRPLAGAAAFLLLFLWGFLQGVVCRLLPGAVGAAAGVIGASLYLAAATTAFAVGDIWAPVLGPVFLQTVLAVSGALILQFRQVRDQRARIAAAMGRYVPPVVVKRLAEEGARAETTAEVVHGTCLATDAEQYTLMAETLAPEDLGRLMNAYYEILFASVERHGGQVSDVVGDSMMAIWASARPDAGVQAAACRAALDIAATLAGRAAAGERAALPTRIGLHSGQIRLGSVGSGQHLEYRAVGDIVNTACRIENLNKQLGTRLLVSAETLAGNDDFRCREVGTFLLVGKSIPVVIHELLGCNGRDDSETAQRLRLFAEALAEFRAGRWAEAASLFRRCLEQAEADGPAAFYLRLCEEYLATGPRSFSHGAIRLSSK